MKLSVSLPEEDVAVLDEFARAAGLRSRSAALHRAVTMLRLPQLEQDYQAAWDEWAASGEHEAWDTTSADGLADAAR
ncbi:ribbon-helix-helix domain-containing protein [Flexivirga alba]|uniref:Ribbon-helix-helix domain-containing protein n=1 Tax=Flexivirga alba TaxID=702742 RepID=A0ABW2AM66_9MICO